MKSDNVVLDKSFDFAVRIVKLYKYLRYKVDEKVLSTQVLKSGTSIGANIREALRSSSRKDFVAKMNISLKEAYETEYWLELLIESGYHGDKTILDQCVEIKRILIASINTAKEKPLQGKVVAVGNGTKDEEMVIAVGDQVLYGKYTGTEVEFEGVKYLIMRQSDVLAILK